MHWTSAFFSASWFSNLRAYVLLTCSFAALMFVSSMVIEALLFRRSDYKKKIVGCSINLFLSSSSWLVLWIRFLHFRCNLETTQGDSSSALDWYLQCVVNFYHSRYPCSISKYVILWKLNFSLFRPKTIPFWSKTDDLVGSTEIIHPIKIGLM